MEGKKTKNTKDKKIEELEVKIKELENQLKRAVADYRNFEKRVEEEKKGTVAFINKKLLLRLLPAFNTLFLADRHVKDDGLRLSIKKLNEVLKDSGVERIETVGRDFDPNLMECVDIVPGEENKVVEEITPGFTLFGQVLHPARVRVGKKAVDEKAEVALFST